jgi:hypothetical protein
MTNTFIILVGKPEGNRSLWRTRHRCGTSFYIKIHLREITYDAAN